VAGKQDPDFPFSDFGSLSIRVTLAPFWNPAFRTLLKSSSFPHVSISSNSWVLPFAVRNNIA
jgi:hypothetical protein